MAWETVREVNEQFREDTTINGVKKLRPTGHGCRRWEQTTYFMLVMLGSTAIGVYQTCLTVNNYLQFAVETDLAYMEASSTNPMNFPAITFCNNNQLFRTAFGSNPRLYMPAIYMMQPSIPVMEGVEMCASTAPAPNRTLFASATSLNDITDAVTEAVLNRLWNHNSLNSVLGCRWQGRPLRCEDVFINHFTDLGNCFTFNAAPSVLDAFYVTANQVFGTNSTTMSAYNFTTMMPGKASGVEFVLYARSAEYCTSGLQFTFGFSALVHERDASALITESPSIELSPGFDIDVAITVEKFSRMTENLGYCRSTWAPMLYPPGWRYTYAACTIEASVMAIVAQCSCLPQYTPPFGADKLYRKGFNLCATQPEVNCDQKIQNNPATWVDNDCIVECEETDYYVRASAFYFPTPNALPQFVHKYNLSDASSAEFPRTMQLDDVRKDYLRVTFFMETLQYKQIVEQQAMSIFDLVNNIGGAIGLSVGISVLSIPETIIWLFRVVAAMLCRGWRLARSARVVHAA